MFLRNLFNRPSIAEVTPEETQSRQKAGAVIVDVREPHEWRTGHIAGAKHIPLGNLSKRIHELNPSKEIITVCRSGHRSMMAARTLQQAGFTQVSSMAGGMMSWTWKQLPVKK
jgi:rhodanese-related sulfurtransferase